MFHLNCFTCMMCNKQLSTGEELYIIDENKFVCKEDYLSNSSVAKENSLHSATTGSDPSLSPDSQDPSQDDAKDSESANVSDKEGVATKMTTRTWAPSDGDRAPPSKPSSWRR